MTYGQSLYFMHMQILKNNVDIPQVWVTTGLLTRLDRGMANTQENQMRESGNSPWRIINQNSVERRYARGERTNWQGYGKLQIDERHTSVTKTAALEHNTAHT